MAAPARKPSEAMAPATAAGLALGRAKTPRRFLLDDDEEDEEGNEDDEREEDDEAAVAAIASADVVADLGAGGKLPLLPRARDDMEDDDAALIVVCVLMCGALLSLCGSLRFEICESASF
jgi:hypothetical protein